MILASALDGHLLYTECPITIAVLNPNHNVTVYGGVAFGVIGSMELVPL